eukprot:scaffold6420_cov168-Amphora_coffeaeformis.AAC.34
MDSRRRRCAGDAFLYAGSNNPMYNPKYVLTNTAGCSPSRVRNNDDSTTLFTCVKKKLLRSLLIATERYYEEQDCCS